jgi:putative FmdB family regulatory protein
MPLYEYECQTEGTRFEVIQKFSDAPVEVCPTCGGPVKRLLSSPAIQFKGSGWYITDYARKGSTDAGKDAKSTASEKSEPSSKPAASTSTSDSGSSSSGSSSGSSSSDK